MENTSNEFQDLRLKDQRLNARGRSLLMVLAAQPDVGAPRALTSAELEGYYRFVNNERVSLEQLLGAHRDATLRRTRDEERVIIAHDTTDFRFSDETEREGLGPMDNGGQGFYAHVSLAVRSRGCAHGAVGVETWTREWGVSEKKTQAQRYNNPEKESLRWMRAVSGAQALFDAKQRVIHVMDREADQFDVLCELETKGLGYVVRSSFDRRLADEPVFLRAFVRDFEVRCERSAKLSSRIKNRAPKQVKRFPPRRSRLASLSFSAGTVRIARPDKSKAPLKELSLTVVHVRELDPPEGSEPVDWLLWTSEPIDTPEQILQVVDDYRARWVIEEFFKALKTGCAFEKRQHESLDALLNALGLFIPIAWSLLNMRTLSRDAESAALDAEEVFTPVQLRILRGKSKGKLSAKPNVGEAVLVMARFLGGLQPSNGAPGWQILGHAYQRLLELETGWLLAVAEGGEM